MMSQNLDLVHSQSNTLYMHLVTSNIQNATCQIYLNFFLNRKQRVESRVKKCKDPLVLRTS